MSIDRIKRIFGKSNWHEDFRRIGNGLVIAGVATPTLSDRGNLLSGIVIVTVGIVMMILANQAEA